MRHKERRPFEQFERRPEGGADIRHDPDRRDAYARGQSIATVPMIIGAEEVTVGRAAAAADVGVFTAVMCARPSCLCLPMSRCTATKSCRR